MNKQKFLENLKYILTNLKENAVLNPEFICAVCGKDINTKSMLCDKCKREFESLLYMKTQNDTLCLYQYDSVVREVIHKLKYDNRADLAKLLGERIYKSILNKEVKVDMITWVPIHEKRLQTRGYDQAMLMAQDVAKRLDLPCTKLLDRTKETKPQYNLGKEERIENISGAFEFCGVNISGKRIILIDDICTTGITMSECAKLIKNAGGEVLKLAFAAEIFKKKY